MGRPYETKNVTLSRIILFLMDVPIVPDVDIYTFNGCPPLYFVFIFNI